MALPQDLKIWASEINIDGVTGIEQRRDLNGEEFRDGILNLVTFTAQQYNSLMYLLTINSAPSPICPYQFPTSESIPDIALEMDGQAILSADFPNLFEVYGANLPDITAEAATGFTFIVRKS